MDCSLPGSTGPSFLKKINSKSAEIGAVSFSLLLLVMLSQFDVYFWSFPLETHQSHFFIFLFFKSQEYSTLNDHCLRKGSNEAACASREATGEPVSASRSLLIRWVGDKTVSPLCSG